MSPTLIRRDMVLQRCGFSTSTLKRLIDSEEFPRPVRISSRSVAWVESEVSDWILERINSRK